MNDDSVQELLRTQFDLLPEPVQLAITSGDIEKKLQGLANKHKLHLDKWQALEGEVLFALLGVKPASQLSQSIQSVVGLGEDEAIALTNDISDAVFEPVREELERQLSHPQAKDAEISDIEKVRTELLEQAHRDGAEVPLVPEKPISTSPTPTITTVAPTTPPAPAPETVVKRELQAPAPVASAPEARKSIANDPYLEQL